MISYKLYKVSHIVYTGWVFEWSERLPRTREVADSSLGRAMH